MAVHRHSQSPPESQLPVGHSRMVLCWGRGRDRHGGLGPPTKGRLQPSTYPQASKTHQS